MIGKDLGQYQVVESLGEGGMAAVYKGFDRRLNRDVAIKVILRSFETKTIFLKRFEREARSVAQLTHPNIVRVINYGTEGDMPYLVMEFIPGGTLKNQMGKPIPWGKAAQMLAPVARALDYAHQEKIIHRDIKPANILVTKSGDLMLSDFGIAKTLGGEEATQLTGTGVGIGTPAYMAPEQGLGIEVDHRADVYSFGVVFYEMITGRPPYQADTPMAVMLKHMNNPLPRPRQYVPEIPEEVEHILFKALAKDPEQRFQSMAEFAEALEQVARSPLARGALHPAQPATVEAGPAHTLPPTLAGADDQPGASLAAIQPATIPAADPLTADPQSGTLVAGQPHPLPGRTLEPAPFPAQAAQAEAVPAFQRLRPFLWAPALLVLVGIIAAAIFALPKLFSGAGSSQVAAPTSTAVLEEALLVEPSATATLPPPTPTQTPLPASPTPAPTELPAQLVDGYGIPMLLVPAGDFSMGGSEYDALSECAQWNPKNTCDQFYFKDEEPLRTLTLEAFYIDQYEVTNAAYAQCVAAGACPPPFDTTSHTRSSYYGNPTYDQYPVVYVSWTDAKAFCEWRGARLPSEAEWEKAARGPDSRIYPWGNAFDGTQANFCDGNCDRSWANADYDDGYADTAPVGSYPYGASPYGVHDLAGNVSEWVADRYTPYPGGEADLDSEHYGETYVRRGGSWYSLGSDLRTARRDKDLPTIQLDAANSHLTNNQIGFRCALDAGG